jgi:hypothetical protein
MALRSVRRLVSRISMEASCYRFSPGVCEKGMNTHREVLAFMTFSFSGAQYGLGAGCHSDDSYSKVLLARVDFATVVLTKRAAGNTLVSRQRRDGISAHNRDGSNR